MQIKLTTSNTYQAQQSAHGNYGFSYFQFILKVMKQIILQQNV